MVDNEPGWQPANQLIDDVREFLEGKEIDVGPVYNEHSLQMELGCFLRMRRYSVEFERPFEISPLPGSTRRGKRELDLFLTCDGRTTVLELKVPLAGRVPESMYDFCADLAFVEGLVRHKMAETGLALLVTNNRQFWQGRPMGIYEAFRQPNAKLGGNIGKPTGGIHETVVLSGSYDLSWRNLSNTGLLVDARYLLVPAAGAAYQTANP
jgi:hypothetical protein